MDHCDSAALPTSLRLRGSIDRATERLALRAALAAHISSASPLGSCSGGCEAVDDPLATALAQAKEAELKATLLARAVEIVGARFDKLPDRKRPFDTGIESRP